MTDLIEFLTGNWNLISANPVTFIIFGMIVGVSTWAITKAVLGAVLEVSRERLAA